MQLLRLAAVAYSIAFTVYLPISKYTSLPGISKYRWFVLYILSALFSQVFPYLPKPGKKKWDRAETARLKSTNVAISQVVERVRDRDFRETDFLRIAYGLMVAIRLEVEAIILDTDGTYINASLMAEDSARPENLIVLQRANPDRPNTSYPKEGLVVWDAMQGHGRRYVERFDATDKEYRCILALPLVVESATGQTTSVGVLSIDSGRANEFDGLDARIELRLLPYTSLLKLLLTMREVQGEQYANR